MGAMPYCWFWDSVYLQSLDGLDVGVRLVYNSRILKDPQFGSSVDLELSGSGTHQTASVVQKRIIVGETLVSLAKFTQISEGIIALL